MNNIAKRLKGFSVAEAMIALLIGSLALGAAAPMISKQIKQSNYSDTQFQLMSLRLVPSGAVMAFNRDSCPDGWTPLTTRVPGTEGAFIRNLGGSSLPQGEIQNDAAPNITGFHGGHGGYHARPTAGKISGVSIEEDEGAFNFNVSPTGGYVLNGRGSADKSSAPAYRVDFDASRSSESYGRDGATEVRPKNVALLYCVKD